MFLKILQNSHENTCGRISFSKKLQGLRPATLLKKRLWRRCLPPVSASRNTVVKTNSDFVSSHLFKNKALTLQVFRF